MPTVTKANANKPAVLANMQAQVPAEPQVLQAKVPAAVTQAQKAFTATIERITKAQSVVDDAKGMLNTASEGAQSVRQVILCELAQAAIKGEWPQNHAKTGIDAAIAAYEKAANDKRTVGTLRQVASECLRAVHPKAREHVAEAFAEADRLWDDEGQRIEDAKAEAKANGTSFKRDSVETPLRDTFKRKWHMVASSTGLLAARASDDEKRASLADAPELLADAVASDERQDENRAAKALKRALETIQGIADEFPSPRWDVVTEYLSKLDAKTLAAYKKRKGQTQPAARAPRNQPAASDDVNQPSVDDVNDAADNLLTETAA